ncbi:unnamed protein product [Schistosoma margrebowiei]|uniref:CUB domain-containing protein n=2 Tax=Schistosoma margrebowiei TaxID=48269 RepID=A0AA84ZM72_9TREM|nr:unnamed protein product [Schistosoma margrebowiei]
MRLLPLALTSLQVYSVVFGSYEEYVILPDNSDYCRSHPGFRRFSLSRQMSFVTGSYNSSWNNLLYACKIKVYPNGRLLHYSYPEGHTSYWFHRLRVSINFTSCNDFLTIGFIPEEITQPTLLPYELNLTCTFTFPQIIDSKHRIVSLVWHTDSGSIEDVKSKLDVQMSAYMRFEGTFSLTDKMRRCEVGSGFWCGNQTAVCVYGQMRCDQADDCFDGGTDEIGCPPVRNYTYIQPRRPLNSWSVYLPWTALGLIPLILVFALGLICAPRKSLDELEDDDLSQENECLKTIFSPMTSSSAASPTLSESSSPRSIQSIAACSTGDKVIVCASELTRSLSHPSLSDMVHTTLVTNETNKQKSCLLSSNINTEQDPDSFCLQQKSKYYPESCELLLNNDNTIINHDKRNFIKDGSSSKFFNEVFKPTKSRAVTFQLPGAFEEKSIMDSDHDNIDSDSKIQTNKNREESMNQREAQRNSGNISRQSKFVESDNRAIPACFEMAALKVRVSRNEFGNVTNHNVNPDFVDQEIWNSNACTLKQPNKNHHSHSNSQSQTNDSKNIVKDTNNNDFNQSQSSSSESDREDVTPFRRTDNSILNNHWDKNNNPKLNGVQIQNENEGYNTMKTKMFNDLQTYGLSLSSQKPKHKTSSIIVTAKNSLTSGEQQRHSNADYILL